jgi:1,4-dihydroxy-2-naphthoyl-CoA hydrolase
MGPEEEAHEVAARAAFSELIGLELGEITRDRVTASLEVDGRHHQPDGLVHGGIYCTIIETLASLGAWMHVAEQGMSVVGVHNATDFLRAHRTGRIEAVGEPVHVGRTQQLWRVVVTRASDGKALAQGQVRLQNVPAQRS